MKISHSLFLFLSLAESITSYGAANLKGTFLRYVAKCTDTRPEAKIKNFSGFISLEIQDPSPNPKVRVEYRFFDNNGSTVPVGNNSGEEVLFLALDQFNLTQMRPFTENELREYCREKKGSMVKIDTVYGKINACTSGEDKFFGSTPFQMSEGNDVWHGYLNGFVKGEEWMTDHVYCSIDLHSFRYSEN